MKKEIITFVTMLFSKAFGEDKVDFAFISGAITSPIWLPSLSEVSAFAALLAPIVGVVLLILKIVFEILKYRRERNMSNGDV